jgi:hypothetical protein
MLCITGLPIIFCDEIDRASGNVPAPPCWTPTRPARRPFPAHATKS